MPQFCHACNAVTHRYVHLTRFAAATDCRPLTPPATGQIGPNASTQYNFEGDDAQNQDF